jgi:hypothetical protein
MVLPLFECPPAAGQGAIVVETGKANADALILLNAIKDDKLTSAVEAERKIAHTHGYGCSQQFGVFHLDLPAVSFTYAAGTGQDDFFTEWNFQLPEWMEGKQLFSSARHMKDFFDYDYNEQSFNDIDTDACFVSSHRAVKPEAVKEYMVNKRIWAAGTRTWFQLAQQGTWVEGCADGLGLEWSLSLLQSPLVNLNRQDITILTSHHSRAMWETAGWHTQGVYELNPVFNQAVADEVAAAEILFWTNFQQYEIYKDFVSDNARHCCPCGKTASLFLKAGIQPVVFPTIKAFTQWEKKHTTVTNAG